MTREEAKELLPFIQAFAEGKSLQIWANNTWKDENYPFFGPLSQFRIKPEPKYRLFKNQEECWEEMHKHPDFGWVKSKNNKDYYNITNIYKIRSGSAKVLIENCAYTLNEAFNGFTFTDDTPFGIKEKENE